jgi:hypothetical protein
MKVAVLGGGIAGLAASLAFSGRAHSVTLIERDPADPAGSAQEVFDAWERPGVGHFRQPHYFLGLSRKVLMREAPDVLDRVLAAGAFDNDMTELIPSVELRPGERTCTPSPAAARCSKPPSGRRSWSEMWTSGQASAPRASSCRTARHA